ncbi:hypothetical protein N7508_001011 [Penicillium antarcticum]|uniref:uncharacterized protein n=1 Tax=Penicillium antarcticum TaxID=416450 RepID=UPI00238B7894|nr:uncharacterized protein N7508_001011 [Penicillium antarcticum]KAJ5316503.1 hypothetical protein N7508_001011 [Penicillium antarcticum]
MVHISEAIKNDHKKMQSYYYAIVSSEDKDEQARIQKEFIGELSRHAVSEELVVYPAMEEFLADGMAIADKDRKEHSTIKQRVDAFQDLSSSDPRFLPTIAGLMDDLGRNFHDVETIDLPKLENHITSDESEQLANALQRAKVFVPSDSRPSVPNKPLFETAAEMITAPLENLQGLLPTWLGDDPDPKPAE